MAKKKKGSRQKVRTVTKVKTVVKRVGQKAKQKTKKHGKSIIGMITWAVPITSSLQLLSHNQVASLPANASVEQKFKAMANGLTGSIFNFNAFSDAPKANYHPSIEGAFNQWSFLAVGSIVAGQIGKKLKIKKSGHLSNLGNKLLFPAVMSGVFGLKNNNSPDQKHSPYMNKTTSSREILSPSTINLQTSESPSL